MARGSSWACLGKAEGWERARWGNNKIMYESEDMHRRLLERGPMRLSGSARRYSWARGRSGLASARGALGGVWKLDGQGEELAGGQGCLGRASRALAPRYRRRRTWDLAQDGVAGPPAGGWA